MKVVSVNIGQKQSIQWRGKEVHTGIFKKPVDHPIFLGKTDVTKDQVVDRMYHGGADKACYIFSSDAYPRFKALYPNLEWSFGMFGENITIKGLDESKVSIGETYQLGEAIIQIAQPRQPCYKLGVKFGDQKIVKDFIAAPHPGIYIRVIKEGLVKTGDEMKLKSQPELPLSLLDVHRLIYSPTSEDKEQIKAAIKNEFLAGDCKETLKKKL